MEKEYVLDWTYFSSYTDFDVKNVPEDVRIINYSFYDRYRKELYFLTGLFILTFILVLISLLRMRRRSRVERKNMEMLEETHRRLMLSTDGFANSYKNADEFQKTCVDYFAMIQQYGADAVAANLKSWLSETSAMGCGDDITVLIAYFSDDTATESEAATNE